MLRLASAVPALFGVLVLTFVLMRLLPGDPAAFFATEHDDAASLARLREELGLSKPIYQQFVIYLGDVARGNLGRSLTSGRPVSEELWERLPASLELTLLALVIALSTAIPLGIAAALRPGSIIDHLTRLFCSLAIAAPTFVSALLLIYVFYYLLGWAPEPTGRLDIFAASPPVVTGFLLIDAALAGDWENWRAAFSQLILPAISMALFVQAPLARMTRASMLAVMSADFIRTARAIGLPSRQIAFRYAFRNALLPVLTTIGIIFSSMLGANVLVEKVFSWPGVASYALDALLSSDYAPVQGFVLMMAFAFVLVNLIVDILYGIADPRVSVQ